jgi:membrane protease YdiL (CAAX protease family)
MAAITTAQQASTSSLKRFIIRHPVAAFLGMVYGISWLLFLPSFLSQNGIGVLPFEIPAPPFVLLSVIFGITLPAYIVTRVTGGREGVRELRRRYTHWRVGIGWYLVALFALPIADLLGASLWLGTGPLEAFAGRWEILFTVFLKDALVNAIVINLLEEGGWTGFLLPRLQERWGALRSSAIVAAAMGLFHTPLIFIVTGVSDTRIPPDRYWFYVFMLFVAIIPVRVLVTWLWNSTRGSVIIVALLHGAFNTTTGQEFLPEFVPGDPLWVYGVYAVLALIVIALTRGRLAYRGDPASRPVAAHRPNDESVSRA